MRVVAAGIIMALSALRAEAGAWPREEGKTFVSLSQVFTTGTQSLLAPTETLTSYSSIYAEYGLTGAVTIGFDAGYGMGPEARLATGIDFVRRPIWESPSGQRFAADFGVGWRTQSGEQDVRLRPGIAWGRGFESAWGGGWMGVDASAELMLPSDDTAFKVDFTTGLKPNDDWMVILQVQSGRYPGSGAIARLAPSVVRAIGERSHIQLGLDATVLGDDSIGVKLGTWFSF